MCREIVLGLIVEVLPHGPFPCSSVWSPSCRQRPGSGRAGRLARSGWLFVEQSEGRRHDPTAQHCGRQHRIDDVCVCVCLGWGVTEGLSSADHSGCSDPDG